MAVGFRQAIGRRAKILAHLIKEAHSEGEEEHLRGVDSRGRASRGCGLSSSPSTVWIIKLLKCQNTCDGYEGTTAE